MNKLAIALTITVVLAVAGASSSFSQVGDPLGSEIDPLSIEEQNLTDLNVETSRSGVDFIPGELVVIEEGGDKENNVNVISVPEADTLVELEERAGQLENTLPDVKLVEPNLVRTLDEVPNDPQYDSQYHFRQIGAPTAWNHSKGAGMRICIIDSGYYRDNPEFDNVVVAERDLVQGDNIAQDSNSHGSHVAGIAALRTDNGVRTAGVGWSTKLVIAKAFNSNGTATSATLASAINYCQNAGGVSTINMSYGSTESSEAERAEIVQSYERFGMTLVASAGNNYAELAEYYPAAYQYVIGVGATDQNGNLAAYSNRGVFVDLTAPGTNILSVGPNNTSGYLSGTSMAAPQVSGSAAILRASGLSTTQIQSRLFNQSEDRGPVGKDNAWGHGFLNVKCAVKPTETGC